MSNRPDDTTSRTFYPSCVVNLTIRFDEAGINGSLLPKPVSTEEAADEPSEGETELADKSMLLQPGANTDTTTFVLNRVPKKCSVEKGSVRQAATFNLDIDFRDLPLDPRTIRAMGVEIHMGTVTAEDFARGMRGERRADGSLFSTLSTRDAKGSVNESTLVLVGIVDEFDLEEGNDGLEIHLSGRDQRGLLLNSPLSVTALNKLDYSQNIASIVRELLSRHPMSDRLRVVANPAEWPNGRLPAALPKDILPRPRRARARGGRGGRGRGSTPVRDRPTQSPPPQHPPGHGNGSGQQLTYWDAITRLCFLVGGVPSFRGNELLIRSMRGLFQQQRAGLDPNIATPFNPDRPRNVQGMGQFNVRRLVMGRNLSRLKLKRKLGGHQRPQTIRCVSLDLSSNDRANNRVIEGRWPPEPTRNGATGNATAQVAAPSGGGSQENIQNIPIQGIRDVERLTEIARALFEEIGRNEIQMEFETADLTSFGGSNADTDMLRAEPGDLIEVVQDSTTYRDGTAGSVSSLTDHYSRPVEEQIRELTERLGGGETFARAIVASARGRVNPLQRSFRLASLKLDWTLDRGLVVTGDLQNYIVIRYGENGQPTVAINPLTEVVADRRRSK